MTPYWPLYGGLAAYGFFLLACITIGFKGIRTPIQSFCIRHVIAAPFALAALIGLARMSGDPVREQVIGVLLGLAYFGIIHYAVGLHLFGVAQRSVSTNLLIQLYRSGGHSAVDALKDGYGGDKSLDFVTQSRLAQMESWEWIETLDQNLQASRRGRLRVQIGDAVLRGLGLRPMEGPAP